MDNSSKESSELEFIESDFEYRNEIINEGHSVQILDIDANEAMARQYNVRSVPTTIIEENGVEVDRFIGALPKQSVIQKLNG